ncbi:MAG: response regulator transcription factor [Thermotogae bacterium]|nr:response regulator transcription factor [Thermotogota bacterium]
MKILVIDDEESILDLIRMNLILENYEVVTATDGKSGMAILKKEKPDFIILDIMLPDIDGFSVLQEIRNTDRDIPVIMLTAKNQINDKLTGLHLGADDYITKPFDSREVILRIKAIEKRMDRSESSSETPDFIKIDVSGRRVFIDGEEKYFTKKEFEIINLFAKNPNIVFSRDALLEKIWGYDVPIDTRAVDMLIQRVRKKMGIHGEKIISLYGIGYKFEV